MIDLAHLPIAQLRSIAWKAQVVEVDADVARRALVAFLKHPASSSVHARAVGIASADKAYVALIAEQAIGAVYRVRNDLQLKRLRRIPEAVAYLAELHRRDVQ